ncbi:MAG: hypothetical protein IJG23_05750 [Clostridia bacterium]|nr:hypothetical protein [Clostridia bacterium]
MSISRGTLIDAIGLAASRNIYESYTELLRIYYKSIDNIYENDDSFMMNISISELSDSSKQLIKESERT